MPKRFGASRWIPNSASRNAREVHRYPLRRVRVRRRQHAVYYFVPEPGFGPSCRGLLERFAARQLVGFTSAHVLTNVAHRIMTLEAMARLGWPAEGIARRLLRQPEELRQLTRFRQVVDAIPGFGIQVLPITMPLVSAAAAISQQHGLLSGDALVVAVMRQQGLTHLASRDGDFDRVPNLTRYSPA